VCEPIYLYLLFAHLLFDVLIFSSAIMLCCACGYQCSAILVFSMFLHHYAHGGTVFVLKHRSHFKDGESVVVPDKQLEFTVCPSDTKNTDICDDEDGGDTIIP
jgi:hypothetical protein